MSEARNAWETGGRDALTAALARFQRVTHAKEAILTDANGTDLLSGEQHAELISEARNWSRFPFSGRHGTTFARFSSEGLYCFFLMVPLQSLFSSNLQPAHLLVLAIAVLLCYALAYHLTAPLRRLQKVERRQRLAAGIARQLGKPVAGIALGIAVDRIVVKHTQDVWRG